MKWKLPEYGATRWVRRFAFLPTRVENHSVWLGCYFVKQEYVFEWRGIGRSLTRNK